MSGHDPRRGPGGLAAAFSAVVAVLFLAIAPAAHAGPSQPPGDLPQLWGVEVDDDLVDDIDRRLAKRMRAAGLTLVAHQGRLAPAARHRLEAKARRWDLRVLQPLVVTRSIHAGAAPAASECGELKRVRPGSRCAVQTDSVAGTASLSRATTDVIVVRSANARAFVRLDEAAGPSRMAGILRLTDRSYRPARWRAPIRAAQRSQHLDLVVQPSGVRWQQALQRYLRQLAQLAPGDRVPPSDPQDLAVIESKATSVALAWAKSSDNEDVAGYGIYRDGAFVGSTARSSVTVDRLTCGAHLVEIDAVDRSGNRSAKSFVMAASTECAAAAGAGGGELMHAAPSLPPPLPCTTKCRDKKPPSQPADLRQTDATASTVSLAWSPSADDRGVAGYRVFRDGTQVAAVSGTSATVASLACGRSYTFAVGAHDAAGNVSTTATLGGSTSACPSGPDTRAPSVPPNQRYTSITRSSVTLAWEAASDNVGVTGYRLYLNGARVASTPDLTHTFSGLTCGTSYTFALEASDAAGNVSDRTYATGTRRTEACEQPPPDPDPEPEPSGGLAHLWIDGNGGSCTRSATPVAYSDTAACGSPAQAYSVANGTTAGTTILIRGGTYSGFRISGSRSSANRIVFDAAPGEDPVFRGGYMSLGDGEVATTGPDYVTLKNLTTGEFGPGHANPDNRFGIFVGQGSSFVRLENMRAGNFLIQASQNIEVIGGEYGPCRAADQYQQCEINKVDHYPGAPQPKNILIDDVYFHDYDLGSSCFKPSDGGTSTGSPDCHWRSMYLNGVHDLTLRNSRFRESFIAPWMTISGPDAARAGNRNILVENNVFGTGVNYGNPGNYNNRGYGRWEAFDFAWCQNVTSGVMGYENVTFRFNSSSRAVGLFVMFSQVGCQQKVRNVRAYGNVGFRNGCDAMVEYRYNVYANAGTCDATDRSANAGGSLPFYANDTHSPGPDDYALTGPPAAPDNLVPVTMGCPATDRKGRPRGQGGFCDAGAYER